MAQQHVSSNDNSGFTPQQRHDVIMQTLTTLDKGPQCFQLRWREKTGEYLTGEILLKTPMFWFMKYKWSRQEIETLFFRARVVIDEKFDMALQQTFGGDPGPRWKGGGGVNKRNWQRIGDIDQNRVWHEGDDEKKGKDDDYVDPSSNDYKFQYRPVDQPVDFQASGGTNAPKTEGNLHSGFYSLISLRAFCVHFGSIYFERFLNQFVGDIFVNAFSL